MRDHGIKPEKMYPSISVEPETIYPSISIPSVVFEECDYKPGDTCTIMITVKVNSTYEDENGGYYQCDLIASAEKKD